MIETTSIERTLNSYKHLVEAQEKQLTALRQRLYELGAASKQIESERRANEELTNQLASLQEENKRLREAEKQRNILLDDCKTALEYTYEEQYQKVIEIINTAFNRLKGIL